MQPTLTHSITFPGSPDDFDYACMREKGFLQGVVVKVGTVDYEFVFMDTVRLAQDIELDSTQGQPFAVWPNLIVLDEVTESRVRDAIAYVVSSGSIVDFKGRSSAVP
jgi:hypothetical protein